MRKYTLVYLCILIFLATIITAQPPFQQQTQELGLEITGEQIGVIKQNQDFTFNIHVFNNSNFGKPVTNATTNCTLHLINSSGYQLTEISGQYQQNLLTDNEWDFHLLAGNFSVQGDYAVNIQCYSSNEGGVLSLGIIVSYGGLTLSIPQAIWYSFSVITLMLLLITCIYGSIKIPDANPKDEYGQIIGISQLKYLRFVLWGIAYWLLVAINFVISGVARNFLPDLSITKLFFFFFTWQMRLSIPIMIICFIYLLIEVFRDKELKNLMERGLPTNGK